MLPQVLSAETMKRDGSVEPRTEMAVSTSHLARMQSSITLFSGDAARLLWKVFCSISHFKTMSVRNACAKLGMVERLFLALRRQPGL